MRVYELARELDMHSYDLIDQLSDIGIHVCSPLCGLQDSEIACYRYHAGLRGGKAYRAPERGSACGPRQQRRYATHAPILQQETALDVVYEHAHGQSSPAGRYYAVPAQTVADEIYEHRKQVAIAILKITLKCIFWGGLIFIVLCLFALYVQLLMVLFPFAVFAGIDKMLSSKPRGRRR